MSVTLYQFELCPFCHKVKATLDAKGIPYRTVEVNPMTKEQLPALPEGSPKKVPVIEVDGEVVFDSTDIMKFVEEKFADSPSLTPGNDGARARNLEVEDWVDDEFAQALPTVIYGTWGESLKAAQVTARTSNFGFFQNLTVRAGGPLIMHQVSKRILKKHNKTDAHGWVSDALDQFEGWLGDADFVAGEEPGLGDAAMHGAMTCVKDFPIFPKMMQRPKLAAWYDRFDSLRQQRSQRAAV